MEPMTLEDLRPMRETSEERFDGQPRHENVRKGAAPEAGAIGSASRHVVPTPCRARAQKSTHVICDVKVNGNSSSRDVKNETAAECRSMAEFRAGERREPTMEGSAGGDADASRLRPLEPDGEDVRAEPTRTGHGPGITASVKAGRRYRDRLGDTRQGKGRGTPDARVGRMSGDLYPCRDGHVAEGTVKETEEAMTPAERLRDLGIKVGDESMKAPPPKTDEEAGKYGDR